MNAIYVTKKIIFKRLYLVPGMGTFGVWVNCPYAPTTPTVYNTTMSRFPCNFFPRMAPHFCGSWRSPSNLAESRYPIHESFARQFIGFVCVETKQLSVVIQTWSRRGKPAVTARPAGGKCRALAFYFSGARGKQLSLAAARHSQYARVYTKFFPHKIFVPHKPIFFHFSEFSQSLEPDQLEFAVCSYCQNVEESLI